MFPPLKKKGPRVSIAFIGGKGTNRDAYKDDESSESEKSDNGNDKGDAVSLLRKKATRDLVTALGADPKQVDLDEVDSALAAHYEACMGGDESEEKEEN